MRHRPAILIPALLPGALLAGCETEAELLANDRGRRSAFGFGQGSPDFAYCVMGLTQQRDQMLAERRRAYSRDDAIRDQERDDRRAREGRRRTGRADH